MSIAAIENEKVAYGFLCGRDYDTKKYVNNKKFLTSVNTEQIKKGVDFPRDEKPIAHYSENISMNNSRLFHYQRMRIH